MTPERYAALIAKFGLTQVAAAHFLGNDPRTSRRFVSGENPVPRSVALLLELMLKTKKSPEYVAKLDKTTPRNPPR